MAFEIWEATTIMAKPHYDSTDVVYLSLCLVALYKKVRCASSADTKVTSSLSGHVQSTIDHMEVLCLDTSNWVVAELEYLPTRCCAQRARQTHPELKEDLAATVAANTNIKHATSVFASKHMWGKRKDVPEQSCNCSELGLGYTVPVHELWHPGVRCI